MKKLLFAVVGVSYMMVLAMPKPEEIRKAQPLVAELMADDVAALEKGDKTAVQVGEAALEYIEKAETEAVKYVLCKGALQYFVRGKDYDKAADAVEVLRGAVKDIPPEEVADLIRTAAKGVRGKEAPRLLAILKAAQLQARAAKEIAAARRRLKGDSKDAAARLALAEWLAVGGEWDPALEAFAACGGKVKKIAEDEAESKNLVLVADFWWEYVPEAVPAKEGASIVFKPHAADFYRACIADGTITGLRKDIVEKRLKQLDVLPVPIRPVQESLAAGTVREFDLPNGVTMKFVWCPPGTFMMGSPENEADRIGDEKQHRVTLTRGFWLGQFEVTQAQWQKVMGRNPSYFKGDDNRPVESVSWDDCQKFIKQCNQVAKNMVFALPTEAQWEYACRAGTTGPFSIAGEVDEIGWHKKNSGGRTHAVGKKLPNAWNLYDMYGNVWELCADWRGAYPSDCVDPVGAPSGSARVMRGGRWGNYVQYCRSAFRGEQTPSRGGNGIGFRLCCSETPGK